MHQARIGGNFERSITYNFSKATITHLLMPGFYARANFRLILVAARKSEHQIDWVPLDNPLPTRLMYSAIGIRYRHDDSESETNIWASDEGILQPVSISDW